MFRALGRFIYHHRKLVVLVWALVLVVGMAVGGSVSEELSAETNGTNRNESERVLTRLHELDPTGGEVVAIVSGRPVEDPTVTREVQAATAEIAGFDGVRHVYDHYSTGVDALVAEDGKASLVVVQVDDGLAPEREERLAERITDRLRSIEAPSVEVGGSLLVTEEFNHAIERDLAKGEQTALPIALVAMVVIFGGLLAAGLPLVVAFLSVSGAMVVLFVATQFMVVNSYALNVIYLLGIGLGIDYGLLVISRFREERATGADVPLAVRTSVETAGRTVAFSALTVAAAMSGLFAFDDPTFRSFGIAGVGVVVVAMAAATTLLPALLGLVGRRITPARAAAGDRGWFFGIARFVQRRAVPVVVLASVGLAALAIPFLGARFQAGDARYLPRSSETRAVALEMEDRFPARGADPIVVVTEGNADDPAVARYVDQVRALDGVAAASVRPGAPVGTTIVDVVPEGTSQGATAQRLVHELRDHRPEAGSEVGGTAALLVDTKASTAARLPVALGIMAVVTLVLLFLMTGSVAVPLKAIVMNLLSLGASFGAMVWIFQEGHLSGVLGFEPVGSLDLFMPVLIFIFAFGLSMDYEVFLLSRIKEVYDETGDNELAVAVGLQRTGRIITSAALLIVVVFAGFAMGEVLGIKELGVGLAIAVIVDATIVRTLLVPATMTLLGRWNWWAPRPLGRLHERFGLREAPATVAPRSGVPAFAEQVAS